LISIFAKFAPAVLAAASAQNIMNAATAVADALSGPLGWALLAAAAVALTAWGLSQVINQPSPDQTGTTGTTGPSAGGRAMGGGLGRGQFGLDAMVTGPTMFLAGESGSERVTITPQGKTGGGSAISPTINIYGATDPATSAQAVKRELEALIAREVVRRG
jgi:hypothetical protein